MQGHKIFTEKLLQILPNVNEDEHNQQLSTMTKQLKAASARLLAAGEKHKYARTVRLPDKGVRHDARRAKTPRSDPPSCGTTALNMKEWTTPSTMAQYESLSANDVLLF